jgi:hypothetical protein
VDNIKMDLVDIGWAGSGYSCETGTSRFYKMIEVLEWLHNW